MRCGKLIFRGIYNVRGREDNVGNMGDITDLEKIIRENLRVQSVGAEQIPYIDTTGALPAVKSRQNDVVFARRGCGKTLLLHASAKEMSAKDIVVYVNCEDYKNHTIPNLVIEILDKVFFEIESNISTWFWGKSKKAKSIISEIRLELNRLREKPDQRQEEIKETTHRETKDGLGAGLKGGEFLNISGGSEESIKAGTERQYKKIDSKIEKLNQLLPQLKNKMRDFFRIYNGKVENIFLQVDDFYHIKRETQPYVVDYIHRFCKDIPIFFKIATLRHASTLFVERNGQPIGAQERQDFQPIEIDFTLEDFPKTEKQIKQIFYKFGELAKISSEQIDDLFQGGGFKRLVLAGGGVPRECLSLFLQVLENIKNNNSGKIGTDEIRNLSRSTLQKRIQELKDDSQQDEHNPLLKGISAIRTFCETAKNNVFMVPDILLREDNKVERLIYRLLDHKIIHSVGSAFTNKSQAGTFHAFMIDIGCYANLRKLSGKMKEIDLSETDAKEQIRSAPILTGELLKNIWENTPDDPEKAILSEE